MNVKVLPIDQVLHYKPKEPTYAIRIFSPWEVRTQLYGKLHEPSQNLTHIASYIFDDVTPQKKSINGIEGMLFREEDALQMLTDYAKYGSGSKGFLVSCTRGINRSPAVALAFSTIHGWSAESELAKKLNLDLANKHVYRTILKVAMNYPDLVGIR